jgi:hypothetical protein
VLGTEGEWCLVAVDRDCANVDITTVQREHGAPCLVNSCRPNSSAWRDR